MGRIIGLMSIVLLMGFSVLAGEADWKNPIVKRGYFNSPVCESTPFVLSGRLYRMESWQKYWEIPNLPAPGTEFHEDVVRIWDVEANKIVATPLKNHGFASAVVWDGKVYVFSSDWGQGKPWRTVSDVDMTSSTDLEHWTTPVQVIHAEPGEHIFNVAMCRGKDGFVLLYESDDPKYVPFTFKFNTSDDLIHWKRVPEGFYGKDKYVGGPALYYEGDWYYTLYLQDLGGNWETRITRSKDLVHWEDAPAGRAFLKFDPTHDHIPLRPAQVKEDNASDAELCYWKGKTYILFTGSDQQYAGDLQWAEFDGTPRELFEGFFK
ncbi:MAG TPA: hypothetical protein VFE58_10740 [Tepidisphaeraceae bacterium]|jgi:alpha-L-fucosidase|nr:hypothetical protein [Tepidisphaeraceae bacterium]